MQTTATVKKVTTIKAMEGSKEMNTTTLSIMTKVMAKDMAIMGKHNKPPCQNLKLIPLMQSTTTSRKRFRGGFRDL
jgi:hypothetical protein